MDVLHPSPKLQVCNTYIYLAYDMAFSDVVPSTMTYCGRPAKKDDPYICLTLNSIVGELSKESLMQDAIKNLGEVEDNKVHLPSHVSASSCSSINN